MRQKYIRQESYSAKKILWLLTPAVIFIVVIHALGPSEAGYWKYVLGFCIAIAFLILRSSDIYELFAKDSGKYLELTEVDLTLHVPADNYQGIVRFSEVKDLIISRDAEEVKALTLIMNNEQKISLKGYQGLTEVAQHIQMFKGL